MRWRRSCPLVAPTLSRSARYSSRGLSGRTLFAWARLAGVSAHQASSSLWHVLCRRLATLLLAVRCSQCLRVGTIALDAVIKLPWRTLLLAAKADDVVGSSLPPP